MTSLLVLNGGASVKADNSGAAVRVKDPLKLYEKSGINSGDIVVYDAIIKQLEFTTLRDIGFARAADQESWPRDEPDATIIRGSNYLSAELDLGHVLPLARRLKGAIIPMGLGAQAARYGKLELPQGSVAFWREVAGKCVSIGVRGAYTAEVLADIGIHNVRIIGCPSFYRSLRPALVLRRADPETARIGVTLNKYLAGPYASSRLKTIRLQRSLIAQAARRPGSHVFSQGEREESLLRLVSPPERASLLASILDSFQLREDGAAAALLDHHMSTHLDVDDWAADLAARCDFMVGFRVHGTVMALQQGIPAIYVTYDTRIRELAALYRVPSLDVEDFLPMDLPSLIEAADFTKFEQAYRENYAEYRLFLEENGLRHRLPPAEDEGRLTPPDLRPEALSPHFSEGTLIAWFREEWETLARSNDALRSQLQARFIHRGRA
ncbi:MAG: polysaccharide pyruvyl transferase family protein [Roseococcus sp.]|nr:polysaccharide pyruvyl transferase family protein [Roseococcus sp.]